jgi:uncharacterized tellurite resistance protein B-like protein
MNGKERLYYALGELSFAVALADGKINAEERIKIHDIVVSGTKCDNYEFNVSEIIFHILQKQSTFKQEDFYSSAMKEISICNNFLTEDMKAEFSAVLEKIARAFNKISPEENVLLERFRKDIDKV